MILRLVVIVALALSAGALLGAEADPIEVPPILTPMGPSDADIVMPTPDAVATTAEVVGPEGGDPTVAPGSSAPGLEIRLPRGDAAGGYSTAIQLVLLITVLSVAPGFLVMMTSFTRIIIVLGFLRRALGTQTLPPNQVILGLSLFLTFFVMAPTLTELNDQTLQPYFDNEITEEVAVERATSTLRTFMARHTRKDDLALFIKIAGDERPASIDDVSFLTLVPAFATSELKTAFQMGFIIFLPFVIIDLVIAAMLMALGMMMLPPVMVSLPFKILLFVLVDGWALLIQSLVASYGGFG